MIAIPAINPCGLAEGGGFRGDAENQDRSEQQKLNAEKQPCQRRTIRLEARAIRHAAASASMKTAIAMACVRFHNPPCTAAALTTRLPVPWAVKTLPKRKEAGAVPRPGQRTT